MRGNPKSEFARILSPEFKPPESERRAALRFVHHPLVAREGQFVGIIDRRRPVNTGIRMVLHISPSHAIRWNYRWPSAIISIPYRHPTRRGCALHLTSARRIILLWLRSSTGYSMAASISHARNSVTHKNDHRVQVLWVKSALCGRHILCLLITPTTSIFTGPGPHIPMQLGAVLMVAEWAVNLLWVPVTKYLYIWRRRDLYHMENSFVVFLSYDSQPLSGTV